MPDSILRSIPFVLFVFSCLALHAKTLTVPGDADSIQEAVMMAASGDEIFIATDTVLWDHREVLTSYGTKKGNPEGVIIKNKNLTIIGVSSYGQSVITTHPYYEYTPDSTMLWVENAQVTLRNCKLEKPAFSRYAVDFGANGGPIGAPVHLESGSLILENCAFTCALESKGDLTLRNSTLQGHSYLWGYAYVSLTLSTPSLLIGPAHSASVNIIDSTIASDTPVSYVNVVVDNVANSRLQFLNSLFIGGTSDVGYGSYPNPSGSDGVLIRDSTDIVLTIENSRFQGGNGYDGSVHRHGVISEPGLGGAGLNLIRSSLYLSLSDSNSRITGGKGGRALVVRPPSPPMEVELHPAGQGGSGLSLLNSKIATSVAWEPMIDIQGGAGGEGHSYMDSLLTEEITLPPGPDGWPIFRDESSTIETVASVQTWDLY